MDLIFTALACLASAGAGFFLSVNLAKHNPDKLQKWLAEAQLARAAIAANVK